MGTTAADTEADDTQRLPSSLSEALRTIAFHTAPTTTISEQPYLLAEAGGRRKAKYKVINITLSMCACMHACGTHAMDTSYARACMCAAQVGLVWEVDVLGDTLYVFQGYNPKNQAWELCDKLTEYAYTAHRKAHPAAMHDVTLKTVLAKMHK